MVGQGSPGIRFAPAPRVNNRSAPVAVGCTAAPWWILVLATAFLRPSIAAAAEPTIQLRIVWGGGSEPNSERQWHGTISLDRGTLGLVRPLGTEADEPGSMWLDGNRIEIRPRSARSTDGVDILTTAPLDATLTVELSEAQKRDTTTTSKFILSELLDKPSTKVLDKQGNRLTVRRTPGDLLRVIPHREQLVFSPGETFEFDLEPRLLPVAAGTSLQLKARLIAAGAGNELGVQEQIVKTTAQETSPPNTAWRFKLPEKGRRVRRDHRGPGTGFPALEQAKAHCRTARASDRRGRSAAVKPAGDERRLDARDGNRSGQHQLVRSSQILVDSAGRGARPLWRRRFANLATSVAGPRRAAIRQHRGRRAALGGISAVDQPPGRAAHPRSRVSQRRAANIGHQHFGAQRRRRDDVDRAGFRHLYDGRGVPLGPKDVAASNHFLAAHQDPAGPVEQSPRRQPAPCSAKSACWPGRQNCRARSPSAICRSGCWPDISAGP